MPLRRGRGPEFYEAGGEAHPIRNSPGYSQEAADAAHEHRQHERQAERYRGVHRESSGVQRPEWAHGMSEERLRGIARRVGANPNRERWWQAANLHPGTSEYKYAVSESGAQRKSKPAERGPSRGRKRERYKPPADLPF